MCMSHSQTAPGPKEHNRRVGYWSKGVLGDLVTKTDAIYSLTHPSEVRHHAAGNFGSVLQGKPRHKPLRNKKVAAMTRGAIVESSPRYILSPVAPYRMKMVRPRAKLVVVLRDPTDR